jgi:flagellar basal-body rod modification protein FlgD
MSSISPIGSSTAPETTGPSKALGKDDFLKLLMAQMSNQDPLNPTDDTAFIAQLAQFSSVEQLQSANQNLTNLLVAQAAGNQTAAASLVGKDVQWRSTEAQFAGKPVTLHADLDGPAASVTASLTDASGRTVRTLQVAGAAAGPLAIPWDGKDDAGNALPAGTYTVAVSAKDARGNAVTLTQSSSGRVAGISFAGGTPKLIVDGEPVALADVLEIDQPSPENP